MENPMLLPEKRFDNQITYVSPKTRCGCGRIAKYEVYEDFQPHCQMCHDEATSGKTKVLVRRL